MIPITARGAGEMVRWCVAPGDIFLTGEVIAEYKSADDGELVLVRALGPGRFESRRVSPGGQFRAGGVIGFLAESRAVGEPVNCADDWPSWLADTPFARKCAQFGEVEVQRAAKSSRWVSQPMDVQRDLMSAAPEYLMSVGVSVTRAELDRVAANLLLSLHLDELRRELGRLRSSQVVRSWGRRAVAS